MKKSDYDTKYLKTLDGIRALAILIIVCYHIWQQSWWAPSIGPISLTILLRYGFLIVDMMILISSFCLFIPYARSMVYKEDIPSVKEFYLKRITRIFPSYYLALFFFFFMGLFTKGITFNSFFFKDTIMHIFFVHNWSVDTLLYTNYSAVLWTIAIEVQFYLIFPFIARAFVKKPKMTYSIMMIIGLLCTYLIAINVDEGNLSYYVNHFLLFIPVFANGMLASWFYIKYTKNKKRKVVSDILFTIVSILSIVWYIELCKRVVDNVQLWQIDNRLLLSLVFMVIIISTLLASKIYQKIFDNRLMKFIAVISLNLYIYHHFIIVKLKEARIPYYSGDILPNISGNKTWQWQYTLIALLASIIVASIITYLYEKPVAKYIKKKCKIKG